jgi:hypothetical protein
MITREQAESFMDAARAMQHAADMLAELARVSEGAQEGRWLRMPRPGERCPVCGLGRKAVWQQVRAGKVRAKKIGRASYYSAEDARALLR